MVYQHAFMLHHEGMESGLFASWTFWALLAAGFAALTAIFGKVGVAGVDSDVATLIRTVVILISLAFILLLLGKLHDPGPLTTKTWVFLVLSGLATGASWLCYFRALKLGPASLVAPVDKLSVVLVAVFGVLFLGEHLGPKQWIGVVLVGAGAILLALPN